MRGYDLPIPIVLLIDFLVGVFSVSIFTLSLYKVYRLYQKYPFTSIKLVFLSFLLGPFSTVSVTIILLLEILGIASSFYSALSIFYQIMYTLSVLGICIYAITLISIHPHPIEQTVVWFQVFIGLLAGVSTSAILLTLEYNFDSPGGDIFVEYSLISVLSLLTLIFVLILLAIRHSRLIRQLRIASSIDNLKTSRLLFSGYALLGFGFIILLIRRVEDFSDFIPQTALTFTIPVSLALLFISIAFTRDVHQLILTKSKIFQVLVIHHAGLSLFSHQSLKNSEDSILLSGLFSAFNVSLSEIVSSNTGLSSIRFRDQSILIRKKEDFSIYLIASQVNPVIYCQV